MQLEDAITPEPTVVALLTSAVQKVMAVLAGVLVTKYSVDPDVAAKFTESGGHIIVGILIFVFAQGWAWVQIKREAREKAQLKASLVHAQRRLAALSANPL